MGAPVRPVRSTGQTGVLGMQILYKSYLPHPDSDLDVPHMNLDLLDETYPMVKSKMYFMVFDYTSLTGGTHRSDRSDKTCQFWVRTMGDSLQQRRARKKYHLHHPSNKLSCG
jgi:hypothetical protein